MLKKYSVSYKVPGGGGSYTIELDLPENARDITIHEIHTYGLYAPSNNNENNTSELEK